MTSANSELTTWAFNRKDATRRQLTGRYITLTYSFRGIPLGVKNLDTID